MAESAFPFGPDGQRLGHSRMSGLRHEFGIGADLELGQTAALPTVSLCCLPASRPTCLPACVYLRPDGMLTGLLSDSTVAPEQRVQCQAPE